MQPFSGCILYVAKYKKKQGKIQYYKMTFDLRGPTSEAKNRLATYLIKLGVWAHWAEAMCWQSLHFEQKPSLLAISYYEIGSGHDKAASYVKRKIPSMWPNQYPLATWLR